MAGVIERASDVLHCVRARTEMSTRLGELNRLLGVASGNRSVCVAIAGEERSLRFSSPAREEPLVTSRRGPAPGAMSVVEYRNARLDDADVRVLGPARVSVAASVRADHPLAGDPLALRPSAVIVGGDPALLVRERAPFTVMCGPSGSITVALWLPEAMVVVRCKRLLLESVVDSWIEKVLEGDPDSSLISEGNADDVASGPPETQTLEAS